jgi:hypothetical protein
VRCKLCHSLQILPPQPTDADSDSSQGSGDDLAEGGDASHDQNNKRARQVRSWVDECKKLRGNNKRLSQTVAQHEKTIKSQHLRITSLTGLMIAITDALGLNLAGLARSQSHGNPLRNTLAAHTCVCGRRQARGARLLHPRVQAA